MAARSVAHRTFASILSMCAKWLRLICWRRVSPLPKVALGIEYRPLEQTLTDCIAQMDKSGMIAPQSTG